MSTFERSAEIKDLAAALSKAQGEVAAAKKTSKGNYGAYANITEILEVATPALTNHGLALSLFPSGYDGLTCILSHASGQWMQETCRQKIANENDPQKRASAITFMRKSAVISILGVGAEDDDGQNLTDDANKPVPKPVAPKPAPKPDPVPAPKPDPASTWAFKYIERDQVASMKMALERNKVKKEDVKEYLKDALGVQDAVEMTVADWKQVMKFIEIRGAGNE